MKIFYLIGFPGSGKTSYGRTAAAKSSFFFRDLDQYIEEREQKSISLIFETEGEAVFRDKESKYLKELTEICLESGHKGCLISCGGGTPCFGENHTFMKQNGKTIFLNTPFSVVLTRLIQGKQKRPMTQNLSPGELESKMQELYHQRLPEYMKADYIISALPHESVSLLRDLLQKE
ncbi:MAG: shikimate kinase [Bacteroidia bacterium]|nr:shikimate kinase [Bacteroidia bacterium]